MEMLRCQIHETIAKVTDDVSRRYKFNTAIAAVMEMVNALSRVQEDNDQGRAVMQEGLEAAVLLLAPIIPHCTDILWRALGHESELLLDASWPRIDERALVRNEILNIVQVNGKKRAEINVSANCPKNKIVSVALADPNVKRAIKGMEVVKIVHVPGRLINIVVR